MDPKQLRQLMPKNAQDIEGARELLTIPPNELGPVIPEMLRHLKHHESPVSAAFADFFAKHGEAYAGAVCSVLGRNTLPEVRHVLLSHVLPAWSKDAVSECAGVLSMIVTDPTAMNADLWAIRLLGRHRLAEPQWLRQWLQFKLARLSERSELANQVATEIESNIH